MEWLQWIGQAMTSNLAIGVILFLGFILYRTIERKADAKANGHFSARDREVLHGLADVLRGLAEASTRYYERGLMAMTTISESKIDIGELEGHMELLVSQMLVTNTQLTNALTQLLANDKDGFLLLRDLRDAQIRADERRRL